MWAVSAGCDRLAESISAPRFQSGWGIRRRWDLGMYQDVFKVLVAAIPKDGAFVMYRFCSVCPAQYRPGGVNDSPERIVIRVIS